VPTYFSFLFGRISSRFVESHPGVTAGKPWMRDGAGWQLQPGVKVSATLFGCREGEKVYYGKQGGQSYFTEALVEGLTGKAATPEGAVTLRLLAACVERRVPEAVREEQGDAITQRPIVIAPPESGDAILRPRRHHPPPVEPIQEVSPASGSPPTRRTLGTLS
jgi:hypothetical protein